jgi:hypothetical protein
MFKGISFPKTFDYSRSNKRILMKFQTECKGDSDSSVECTERPWSPGDRGTSSKMQAYHETITEGDVENEV